MRSFVEIRPFSAELPAEALVGTPWSRSPRRARKQDPSRVVPAIVWRRTGAALRSWTVHKRYQQGDLLALLSEDGMEIEILEVLACTMRAQRSKLSRTRLRVTSFEHQKKTLMHSRRHACE